MYSIYSCFFWTRALLGNQNKTTFLGCFHVHELLVWRSLWKSDSDSSSLWNYGFILCFPLMTGYYLNKQQQQNKKKTDALCRLFYNNIIEFCNVFDSCLGCQPRMLCLNRCDMALSNIHKLRFTNYKLFSFIALPAFQSLKTFTSGSKEQGKAEQSGGDGKEIWKGSGREIRMHYIQVRSCQGTNLINKI